MMNELEWIYDQRKDTYDLTLTTTAALDDGYAIDVPVIRGTGFDRRFDLYKECEEDTVFVFSVEFFFKDGQDRYSHGHPYDAEDALGYMDRFMAGTSVFDK